ILATIPVSTASNERSFSNLKRIKTYLQNSRTETRLNGLAMMSIHRDEQCLTVDAVLTELGKTKRRIDFIFMYTYTQYYNITFDPPPQQF
ncbi:52 kDa repressor of the inhibitor of the protein kinase-like, partial [Aphis craccivora]